jgi:voltage-gated potassium channel Kch
MKKIRLLLKPQSELLIVCGLLLLVWAAGSVFYHLVEGLSYVDSLYFTAVTLTTVGYGDFAPQTDAGKIFTSIYAFLGIALFFGFAAALFQALASSIKRKRP